MGFKVKDISSSAIMAYVRLVHGPVPLWRAMANELAMLLFGQIPGMLGIALRRIFYPFMFASCGKGVVFGQNLSIRHPGKIRLGDRVILDDYVQLDAKGESNRGITIGNGAFIGRGSKIYCKNGDITLEDRVNVSSLCTIYSNNSLLVGTGTMIGAYSYILSGGEYDMGDPAPFADQCGMGTKGPLAIGRDCWIGARATILDGAQSIGERSVIAASALVNRPVAPKSLVGGVPARELKPKKNA